MKLVMPVQPGPDLYSSVAGSFHQKDIVYTKYFRSPSSRISLRPFCIASDVPVINNWAWKASDAADLIAASYAYTKESDFARSYMVTGNKNRPVCEADFSHAWQDELCDQFLINEGDYILRLLLSGKKNSRTLLYHVLQTCLEYFFRFPGVERILMEPDADHKEHNELLLKCGFRFQQTIYQSYKTSNLYFLTRQEYLAKRTN